VEQGFGKDVPVGGVPVGKRLRVLSMVEGTWVTGPIKPLLMFARLARNGVADQPPIDLSLMTTVRSKIGVPAENLLLSAARELDVGVEVLVERRAWDLRVMTQLCRVIDAYRPDIIETHQVKCHFILAQALLWRGTRRTFAWIAFHHGYTRANAKLSLYEMLDRWSLRKPDKVVTVCRPFAAELIRHGVPAERVAVISNAIEERTRPDNAELCELRRQWSLSEQDFVIISVGRLSPEKGHIDLLDAFRRLCREARGDRGLRLMLVGDGPSRAELERAAGDLGDRVRFLGHQSNVWPLYFLADVFALPSHTEGSPLVLLEAMAAERAIVATAVGGVPETVNDGLSARLIPPHDVEGLRRALEALYADAPLRGRLGQAARRELQKFSPEAYRDRVWAVYKEVLRSDRPRQAH